MPVLSRSTLPDAKLNSTSDIERPHPATFLASNVLLALACLAPVVVLYATDGTSDPDDFMGPMLIAVLSGIMFACVVGSKTRRLYEMVIWLFVYVFFGIAPMIQMRLGMDTDTATSINHTYDWQASGVVLAGCAAFALGVYWRGSRPPGVSLGSTDSAVNVTRANLLTLACLALFAYYVSKVGFSSLFLSRADLDLARNWAWPDKTINALINGGTSMGLLVSTIAQMYVRRQRKAAGLPRPWLLPFVSFVVLIICVNPVNSARYVSGTVILAMLGAFGAYSTVTKFRAVSLGAILGLVYLFPIADMFRRSLDPSAKSQNPLQSMLSGDFDSFAQVINTVDYVSVNGITWGQQLLGVIFFWVPRSIWPDKAVDTGVLIGGWKGYSFRNLSAPLWAELYINGGWVLLILGMLAIGVAVRRLDRKSEAHLAATGYPNLLACIVPFYLLIVLRGSLLQSVAFVAVILAACLFVRQGPPTTKNAEKANRHFRSWPTRHPRPTTGHAVPFRSR